jgi:glutamine amidotransferase-like uncharacterized protein
MKPTIALFIYDPKCSVQSGNGIMKALGKYYDFKLFSKNKVESNFFDNVNMIAVPGGFGDVDSFTEAFKKNGDDVKNFLKNGGHYLGICMGAYWAGRHYFDILDSVDAVQYLKQPGAETRRPHAKNIAVKWYDTPTAMFWYDGCALVGDHRKFKTVARYANGDPMAIIQNNLGLIGCHPESEQFWYDSYSWMKGKYHNGLHHDLLLDFVTDLRKQ